MSSNKDTLKQTVIVALLLCLVCSVIVSSAAVMLKQRQQENKLYERNRNVLSAAGLYEAGEGKEEVTARFERFQVKLVDLSTGSYLSEQQMVELGINVDTYDQRRAAKDPQLGQVLPASQDIASIKRQARYAAVYVLEQDNKLDRVVLPIHGYGLWSTLYGFMAVEGDGNSILGLTFYEHGETPGLGGEVDNPRWKALWPGKQIAGSNGDVAITVVKGRGADAMHEVDGLSGATLTARGVNNLVQYWVGQYGFGPYLARLRAGEV